MVLRCLQQVIQTALFVPLSSDRLGSHKDVMHRNAVSVQILSPIDPPRLVDRDQINRTDNGKVVGGAHDLAGMHASVARFVKGGHSQKPCLG